MLVIVNGESCSLEEPHDLAHVFRMLQIPSDHIAVMVNQKILPKAGMGKVQLREGDFVEIVTLVAGG